MELTARLAEKGDILVIASFILMSVEEATGFSPRLIFVNNNNEIKKNNS